MRIIFPALFILLSANPAVSAVIPKEGCFDFNEPRTKPLREPMALAVDDDAIEKGDLAGGVFWAAARGIVNQPLRDVYQILLDHYNWKTPSRHNLKTAIEPRKHFMEFHRVQVEFTGLVFISIDWEEEWAYALTRGTAADPKEILISYQKSAGTQHLDHLCGSVLLSKKNDATTDVFLYEEAKATRGDKDDVAKAHKGTLNTLRTVKPVPQP